MTAPIFAAAVIVGLYLLATVVLLTLVRRWSVAAVAALPVPEQVEPAVLPDIPGYTVWQGRRLLHARHEGCPADARADHRPWHVVASTAEQLLEAAR